MKTRICNLELELSKKLIPLILCTFLNQHSFEQLTKFPQPLLPDLPQITTFVCQPVSVLSCISQPTVLHTFAPTTERYRLWTNRPTKSIWQLITKVNHDHVYTKLFLAPIPKEYTGLNFINVLHTGFTLVDPKRVKRHWWLNSIFYTFGIYKCKSCM